jgi:hypothetical protein
VKPFTLMNPIQWTLGPEPASQAKKKMVGLAGAAK